MLKALLRLRKSLLLISDWVQSNLQLFFLFQFIFFMIANRPLDDPLFLHCIQLLPVRMHDGTRLLENTRESYSVKPLHRLLRRKPFMADMGNTANRVYIV